MILKNLLKSRISNQSVIHSFLNGTREIRFTKKNRLTRVICSRFGLVALYVTDSLKRTDSRESFAPESNCTGRVAYFARTVDQLGCSAGTDCVRKLEMRFTEVGINRNHVWIEHSLDH